MQCKVGLGVQHTGRVQSARPAARVNNSTCAGKSHTRTAAVLQQAACVNADGQIYCKTFLGGPILTENEGKNQSTRLQIHPMIKIWQSILFCLSHRRFPSLCRSLSKTVFQRETRTSKPKIGSQRSKISFQQSTYTGDLFYIA